MSETAGVMPPKSSLGFLRRRMIGLERKYKANEGMNAAKIKTAQAKAKIDVSFGLIVSPLVLLMTVL